MLCRAEHSQLLIIDIQERLAAAMPKDVLKKVVHQNRILIEAAGLLEIPVLRTEQYPKGLGPTDARLLEVLPAQHSAFEKTCFSSCGATAFEEALLSNARKQIIITGMEAHVCVLQTAFELVQKQREVFVVADAVCSRYKFNYKNALQRLRQHGVSVTSTESVLFEWLRDASHPQFKAVTKLIR